MSRFWRITLRVIFALSLLLNAVVLGFGLRLSHLRDTLNGGSDGLSGLPRSTRAALREATDARRP